MKRSFLLFKLLIVTLAPCFAAAPDPSQTLWYKQPATDWLEAVPVGGAQGSKPQRPVVLESVKIAPADSIK